MTIKLLYLETTCVSWVPSVLQAILITFEEKFQEEPNYAIKRKEHNLEGKTTIPMQTCEGMCGSENVEKESKRE